MVFQLSFRNVDSNPVIPGRRFRRRNTAVPLVNVVRAVAASPGSPDVPPPGRCVGPHSLHQHLGERGSIEGHDFALDAHGTDEGGVHLPAPAAGARDARDPGPEIPAVA